MESTPKSVESIKIETTKRDKIYYDRICQKARIYHKRDCQARLESALEW
ncbi:hypothetical protein DCO58_00645 [Helicobacter saguini]|uniref:Uncharacterized protein n=1 Tax=Helicobacter saguini TaxID=1548018 RepID=A0A6B0HUS5_9HELI|nr:hypothetical protein [Helicobacter saguini]MWV63101.1 hypothetical protein [Helicobacter saguini]MWV66229.1 hypothetical protein [Helicobacter saguini]MWV68580.1 hypothetical protein [Helicobacter saguini]MWV71867.1 hypothetical protein [Helicobacter saguini]